MLTSNPVREVVHYRSAVFRLIPRLASLDDKDVVEGDRRSLNEEQMTQVFQNVKRRRSGAKANGGVDVGADVGSSSSSSSRGSRDSCAGDEKGKGTSQRGGERKTSTTNDDDKQLLSSSDDSSRSSSPYDGEAEVMQSLQGEWSSEDPRGSSSSSCHRHQEEEGPDSSIGSSNGSSGSSRRGGGGRGGRRPMGGRSFVSKSTDFATGGMISRPPVEGEDGGESGGGDGSGTASSSSELTHGADVVFAGSVAGAVRRRKKGMNAGSVPGRRGYGGGRPSTAPSRGSNRSRSSESGHGGGGGEEEEDESVSITATLDRAQALETEMTDRDTSNERRTEILSELRTWRPDEGCGSSRSGGGGGGSGGSYNSWLGTSGGLSPRRRPTSSSSAPETPDVVSSGRRAASSASKRGSTRQPGQTAGVLVEWPGKEKKEKKEKEKEKRRRESRREKKEEEEEESAGGNASSLGSPTTNDDGPATSPTTHARSPTSSSYQHRRYASQEDDEEEIERIHRNIGRSGVRGGGVGGGGGDGSGLGSELDEEEDEVDKQNANIERLEKWGLKQGFRPTESPPPTPRRAFDEEEEDGKTWNGGGVSGAREKSGRYGGIQHGSRTKTGIKRRGRGSPNAGQRDDDEEEYHPTGSNFVVPSVEDEVEDEGEDVMATTKTTMTKQTAGPFLSKKKKERKENRKERETSTKRGERTEGGGSGSSGETALSMTDAELISMLKLKPKRVPQLRTEEGFQQFFNGIEMSRMRKLLEIAYEHLKEREREKKVQRRLRLLDGHMVGM